MELKEIFLRKTIPVVINSFNQKFYLNNLVEKFLSFGFKNIFILDNLSTNENLLDYYRDISTNQFVTIVYYGANRGPRSFHLNGFCDVIGNLPHIYTDPDLDFEFISENYVSTLLGLTHKYKTCKAGSALQIPKKNEEKIGLMLKINGKIYSIRDWESQFWMREVEKEVYIAPIDTTIHLFNPQYYVIGGPYITGVRVAKEGFIAKHLPWYESLNQDEQNDMLIYKNTQTGWNNY
jgi:hypothetical protein